MKIDDGDTFKARGVVIRILGLDTPEIKHPQHGFPQDQPFGRQAAAHAAALFDSAAVIEYVPSGLDRYGRTLAHVFVDGELFAVKMIEAGLAYETVSFYGDNGFPDLAGLILERAEKVGPPPFQNPYQWRKEHRGESRETATGILKKILDWINR
jgi:endonuclease YncB( thermonuclease family)